MFVDKRVKIVVETKKIFDISSLLVFSLTSLNSLNFLKLFIKHHSVINRHSVLS